jgi:hypothetical protein
MTISAGRERRRTRVFTFWEPRALLTPYLRLCMQTWPAALAEHEIVVLDHERVGEYLDEAPYDMELLRRLRAPIQKDAIMIAVLRRHGGVFIDADTIAVGDIAPLLEQLDRSEVVMFGSHLAMVAARAGAALLEGWYARIGLKLAALASGRQQPSSVPWDYLGNSVLASVMDDIMGSAAVPDGPPGVGRSRDLERRRRERHFAGEGRRHLCLLDREDYAFMPEHLYYGPELPECRRRYQRYWFQSAAPVESALRSGQMLIGLHNSWTPRWYQALAEEQVLESPCLLSRTLRYLLIAGSTTGLGAR